MRLSVLLLWLASVLTLGHVASAIRVKFMCGVCEENFLNCMMNCQMEDYITRNTYDRKRVYVGGRKTPKAPKNTLDKLFENYMHEVLLEQKRA